MFQLPPIRLTNVTPVAAALGVVAVAGVLALATSLARVAVAAYRRLLRPAHSLRSRYGQDAWAVVTGATDGIGKAAAAELARRGLNVLLVSRTQSKLDETAAEIRGKAPKVRVDTLRVDFSSFGAEERARVAGALRALPGSGLAVLINNVGVSYEYPTYFDELDDAKLDELTRLNCDSTVYMSSIALRILKDKPLAGGAKRRGAVINVASGAGLSPTPFLSQYSAAKAFIVRLTEGLASEYAPKKIDVQVVAPYFIVSKLAKIRKASLTVPTPETFAKVLCDSIGYETVLQPYLPHAVMEWALTTLPFMTSVTRATNAATMAKAKKKRAGEAKGE